MIRLNLRFVAISFILFLSTQVFVHAMVSKTERLLSKDAEISEKIATGMRLIQYDPQARFGEGRDILVQNFRNEQDQGAFCSRAVRLLQEVYAQLAAQDGVVVHESWASDVIVALCECCSCFEYDDFDSVVVGEIPSVVEVRIKKNAMNLQSLLADLIESMDNTGRLRFCTTFLNGSVYELYQSDRSGWFDATKKAYPYFLGVESLSLMSAFVDQLRNKRFMHGETLFVFDHYLQTLGS